MKKERCSVYFKIKKPFRVPRLKSRGLSEAFGCSRHNRTMNGEVFVKCLDIVLLFSLIILFTFLKTVDAQSSCCAETKNGKLCENLPSQSCNSLCSQECAPMNCSFVESCKIGCCINSDGTCTSSSTKGKCTNWNSDKNCAIDECGKGCCIIGNNANLYTKSYCDYSAAKSGATPEFFPEITTNAGCRAKIAGQDKGACINSEQKNTCVITTQKDCLSKTPPRQFYLSALCTSPSLNTGCKPTKETTCLNEKDEVYFLDSCSQVANIYSAGKVDNPTYWEIIINKTLSCKSDSANLNSPNCGNCNAILGSVCGNYENIKPDFGQNICKNVNCIDEQGKTRNHGESWCAYEGSVDNGKDIVGSRHLRKICIYGKVKNEPCADYRSELCIQNERTVNGKIYSSSECTANLGRLCYHYNGDGETFTQSLDKANSASFYLFNQDTIEECNSNGFCFAKSVDITNGPEDENNGFKFSACIPRIPPGFDYSNEDGKLKAENTCGIASRTCTVTYQKVMTDFLDFDWRCIYNCNCEEKIFANQMNGFCTAMGDCGLKINIADNPGQTNAEGQSLSYVINDRNSNKPDIQGNRSMQKDYLNTSSFDKFLANESLNSQSNNPDEMDETVDYVGDWAELGASIGALLGPVGAGIGSAIGAAIGSIAQEVFGLGETREYSITFDCLPWQPPLGDENTEQCSVCTNGITPCSKYKCQTLGQHCTFLNEGTSKETCAYIGEFDVAPPQISPDELTLSEGYSYTEISPDGFKINKNTEGCIPAYTPLEFGIKTNEITQCQISKSPINKTSQDAVFLDTNFFDTTHSRIFPVSRKEALERGGFPVGALGEITLYVKCWDASPQKNEKNIAIQLCVDPEPDRMFPLVSFHPNDFTIAKFGSSQANINFFTDEPSDCKWSKSDKEFDLMENNTDCKKLIQDQIIVNGCDSCRFLCNTTVDIQENEEKIFIRCKDQPFELAPEKRNPMLEGKSYTIKKSQSSLNITIKTASNFIDKRSPKTIDLIAATSGGVDGNANCDYEIIRQDGQKIFGYRFPETGGKEHKQPGFQFYPENHTLKVKCIDSAGNLAQENSSINFAIKTTFPIITRVFQRGENLAITTNEAAECRFTNDMKKACTFDFINGTIMQGTGKEHTTPWIANKYYYIKCADIWGNQQGDCGISVKTIEKDRTYTI